MRETVSESRLWGNLIAASRLWELVSAQLAATDTLGTRRRAISKVFPTLNSYCVSFALAFTPSPDN